MDQAKAGGSDRPSPTNPESRRRHAQPSVALCAPATTASPTPLGSRPTSRTLSTPATVPSKRRRRSATAAAVTRCACLSRSAPFRPISPRSRGNPQRRTQGAVWPAAQCQPAPWGPADSRPASRQRRAQGGPQQSQRGHNPQPSRRPHHKMVSSSLLCRRASCPATWAATGHASGAHIRRP